ncbi:MAG: amidohydrolase family protein [Pelagibacterales bacterium]|jgi:N-acyl-D-aspartate/D-glutamate deacylase|nr:amidohydrolase family protein [Pelagibacterales bacterium]MDG2268148.1 amidohydrolase family protein [Alphaproteobacteria bacterium]
MFDLIIKNANIIDGTGLPSFTGDIAVEDGIIVNRGNDLGEAKSIIDAKGLTLAPGFIDSHTHYDAQLTWDPWANPSPKLGVTTIIIGNCGFTIAPCKAEHRDLTMKNLTNVEGMSLDVLREGIVWDFETFPEYLDFIETRGVGPNVAAYVGHSSVRVYVMGEDALTRKATDTEIIKMQTIVKEGMISGGLGFATSTFEGHNGENGVPMPSRLADDKEMRNLIMAMSSFGRGLFMLTRGSNTSIENIRKWMEGSNRPAVVAALLHNPLSDNSTFKVLSDISHATDQGIEMWGQVSCRPLSMEFTMESPYLFEGIHSWRPAMECSSLELYEKVLADNNFRGNLVNEIEDNAQVRLFNGDWDKIIVREVYNQKYQNLEGRSIKDIALDSNVQPLDWLLDHALSDNGMDTLFIAMLLNSDEKAVGKLLKHPRANITLSDAGAHLTFFNDAGYGLYMLQKWVRENKIMSIEEAIYNLTGKQADIYRIDQRGRLVPGQYADMILFDPDKVGVSQSYRVSDLPGGGSRLNIDGHAVKGVWINGERVLKDMNLVNNSKLPGKVIRGFHA